MNVLSSLLVEGVKGISGEITAQGAKNSILPILAATILCEGECCIENCPDLTDVDISLDILDFLGCKAYREDGSIIVNTETLNTNIIPDSLMKKMRSSVIFLGALLARTSHAEITCPGGCELGERPVDIHILSLEKLGVSFEEQDNILICSASDGIKGCNIDLRLPSVGATENIILASVFAKGATVITNAAQEPEISDLADFLNKCGAKISGAGTNTVIIEGVKKLKGTTHRIIPDRIAIATYMACAAVTGGCLTIYDVVPEHIMPIISFFRETGCAVKYIENELMIFAPEQLESPELITTKPYPNFPTDAQPPLMSVSVLGNGITVFVENVFSDRYKHISELRKFGAKIITNDKLAVVTGVKKLVGTSVKAKDLRGGAALAVAALAAEGTTEIFGFEHILRGYDKSLFKKIDEQTFKLII